MMNRPHARTGFLVFPLLWMVVALLMTSSPAPAFTTGEEGYPLPGLDTKQVRKEGVVNRIEEKEIVVDDELYTLLPSTEYYTHVMGIGSVHLFHEGRSVGFIANPKNEILILWLRE